MKVAESACERPLTVIGEVALERSSSSPTVGVTWRRNQPQEMFVPQLPGTASVKLSMVDVFVAVSKSGWGAMLTSNGAPVTQECESVTGLTGVQLSEEPATVMAAMLSDFGNSTVAGAVVLPQPIERANAANVMDENLAALVMIFR